MSSGGISYDCLTTSRKFTLPSVESWGTNMNIVKDPNKGIFTTRKDRVGDTQEVLLAQDASGDRIAENINVYARGVNPMVSVSYNNFGNNAGAPSRFSGKSAHLPYKPDRIIPPMYRKEDLMPLSRQPREWFYAFTNPELPNILQNMSCPEEKASIESKKLNYQVQGNKQYIKDLPQFVGTPVSEIKEESFQTGNVNAQLSDASRGTHQDLLEKNNSKIDHNKRVYEAFTKKTTNYDPDNQKNTVDVQKNIRKHLLEKMVNSKKTGFSSSDKIEPDSIYKNIKEKRLLDGNIETVKSDQKLPINPILEHDSNQKAVLQNNIHTDAITNLNDSSRLKYLPQFLPQNTKQKSVHQDVLNYAIDSRPYSSVLEKVGDIRKESSRNITQPLKYSHTLHKSLPTQEKINLDPSNIQTKQTMCIPVKSSKSQNIHRQVTPIDIETIPIKNPVRTSVESFKTPGEREGDFGERPYREARTLHSEHNLSPLVETREDFYNIQGTAKDDISNRDIYRGSFDPKPQAISNGPREHLDKSHDSSIDYRYKELKSNVQDQFNERYFDSFK